MDKQFTQDWWKRTLADSEKLALWLQKLQRTEISGYTDHIEFMKSFKVTDREKLILTNIAEDEQKHSNLLIAMFNERGIPVVSNGEESTYWAEVLEGVDSVSAYCAANYFGEALAAYRFEVIHEMPETPSDIKEVIGKVLPDEIFHRETLSRMAGEEAMAAMKARHDAAYERLLNGRKITK